MGKKIIDGLLDAFVTLVCWVYFIGAFFVCFFPFYLAAACAGKNAERYFQLLNRTYYRGFFWLLKKLAPAQKWFADSAIGTIRSSVVVCNHLSYLDPIWLVSLLARAKTVVKPVFFSVPIFGWVLRRAGYFPATTTGPHGKLMLDQMETMAQYLQEGGNVFIFPQGTRRKDGTVGNLIQGAFKIARFCKAPVYVLCIRNTERLFKPGRFFFFARRPNRISIRIADVIDTSVVQFSVSELHARVQASLELCIQEGSGQDDCENAV